MRAHLKHLFAAALGLIALAAGTARSQDWPSRPVRLVVPVPTGGGLDPFARAIAVKLGESLKQSFIVENKPGASGSMGTAYVAKSPPDGYNFVFVFDTHAVNPTLIPKLSFDTLKDLAPVTLIGTAPQLIAVPPASPFRDFGDLLKRARTPSGVNIGSTGNGSLGHLALLQIARDGVRVTHIPYKGGGPVVQDLIGNQLDAGIAGVPNMLPPVRNNLIRALAVTSDKRTPVLPDVPTLAEFGVGGISAYTWWGLLAPAGTPKPIIDRMNGAMVAAMQSPDIKKMLGETLGMDAVASTPEACQAFIAGQVAIWQKVIRENNVKAD